MAEWHLITCEYPPKTGGVSDYTHMVAAGLAAAGDEVHVWCPAVGSAATAKPENGTQTSHGVSVHPVFGHFTPSDLRRVGGLLDQFNAPRELLVQWVPQGYGYRSMNLSFCLWLWHRARRKGDRLEIMVHEPFLAFGEGSRKQNLAAAIHRVMVIVLLNAATRIWVSIPDWAIRLRPFVFGGNKPFEWLAVPSSIPLVDDPEGVSLLRAQYAFPDGPLVGHFGAYDRYMTELMLKVLPQLLARHDRLSVLLVGKGSKELLEHFTLCNSELSSRVYATGAITAENVSRHLSACDVMLQPYQDGVSGRRTSVMTALSHGIPVVTTTGKATEGIWAESNAVTLVEAGDVDAIIAATQSLLNDRDTRSSLSNIAITLYRERFELRHVIDALRRSAQRPVATKLKTSAIK